MYDKTIQVVCFVNMILSLLEISVTSIFNIFLISCLKLAVVHDLAECIVGDITPSNPMGKEEKHRREKVSPS